MSKVNKIICISLSGGLIGMLTTNPRKALEDSIDSNNKDGWNAIYFSEHKTSNLFITLLQLLVLIVTLGIWAFGAKYMILLKFYLKSILLMTD